MKWLAGGVGVTGLAVALGIFAGVRSPAPAAQTAAPTVKGERVLAAAPAPVDNPEPLGRGAIHGLIFEDLAGDGCIDERIGNLTREAGEPLFEAAVLVRMIDGTMRRVEAPGGRFGLDDLEPGYYTVRIDPESVPAGSTVYAEVDVGVHGHGRVERATLGFCRGRKKPGARNECGPKCEPAKPK